MLHSEDIFDLHVTNDARLSHFPVDAKMMSLISLFAEGNPVSLGCI